MWRTGRHRAVPGGPGTPRAPARASGPLRQEPPPGPGPGPSDGRLVGLINAAGRGGVTAVNKQIGKPQARDSAAPAAHAVWSGSFHDPSAPRRRRALFLTPGAPRLCPPGRRGSREGRAPRTSGELTGKGGVSTATGPAGCSARTTAGAPGHPQPPPAAPGHPAVAGEHKRSRGPARRLRPRRGSGKSTASSPSGATCLSPGAFASPPPAPGPRLSEPAHVLARQALNAFH